MATKKSAEEWSRAFEARKQQLMGAEAAAYGRSLRVPKGMWKRGGGKAGKTASDETYFEAAYRNFAKGRDRAFAGGYLSSREEESYWFRFGYYSTITVLDMLGDRADKALLPEHVESPANVDDPEEFDEDFLNDATPEEVHAFAVKRGLVKPGSTSMPVEKAARRVEKTPVVQSAAPVLHAVEKHSTNTWRIEFEPDWIEDKNGQEYRVDRITTECVERIGALFLAGEVPSTLDRFREHDMWAEALAAASTGREQGEVEDALWTWAVAAAANGWTVNDGEFVGRVAS
jgi:hypothetical protein